MNDTIQAQDVFNGNAFGDQKSIRIKVDGEKGNIIHEEVKLLITNSITEEIYTYKDTILLKIVED